MRIPHHQIMARLAATQNFKDFEGKLFGDSLS